METTEIKIVDGKQVVEITKPLPPEVRQYSKKDIKQFIDSLNDDITQSQLNIDAKKAEREKWKALINQIN